MAGACHRVSVKNHVPAPSCIARVSASLQSTIEADRAHVTVRGVTRLCGHERRIRDQGCVSVPGLIKRRSDAVEQQAHIRAVVDRHAASVPVRALNVRQQRTSEAEAVGRIRARPGVNHGGRVVVSSEYIGAAVCHVTIRDLHLVEPHECVRLRHIRTELHRNQLRRRGEIDLVLDPRVLDDLIDGSRPQTRSCLPCGGRPHKANGSAVSLGGIACIRAVATIVACGLERGITHRASAYCRAGCFCRKRQIVARASPGHRVDSLPLGFQRVHVLHIAIRQLSRGPHLQNSSFLIHNFPF